MNIKYIYVLIVLWLCVFEAYGQLNQFLILTYHSKKCPPAESPLEYFTKLKDEYKLNTIFLNQPYDWDYDTLRNNCTAIKDADMEAILSTYNLHSRKENFNLTNVLSDLIEFSRPEYNVRGHHIIDEPFVITPNFPYGYNGTSEHPRAYYELIDNIPIYAKQVEKYDKNLLRFANLNSVFFLIKDEESRKSGDQEYRENNIQHYVNTSKPNLLSFDHYPIWFNNLDFYYSLYDMTLKSIENSLPFIYILSSINDATPYTDSNPNNLYWSKSLEEFNYMIFAALSYGAKGIGYYPGFEWIMTRDRNGRFIKFRDGVKESLIGIHQKLLMHSNELLSLNFVGAYHRTNKSTIIKNAYENIHPFSLWSNFINDKYAKQVFTDMRIPFYETSTSDIPDEIAVTFLTNKSGQVYFWLFNKSLSRSLKLKLNLKNTCRDVLNEAAVSNENIINLSPGEAKLFTPITQSPLIYTQIADQVYDNEFYPLETAHIFNFGFSTSDANSITFNSGATKSFVANSINIKSMHAKPGSIVRFKSYEDSNKIPPSVLLKRNIESAKYSPTDVEAVSLKEEAYVYPNPASNHIYLHIDLGNGEEIEARICDITGNTIKILTVSENETFIPISDIPAGIFFIHFMRNNNLYNFKVIKR